MRFLLSALMIVAFSATASAEPVELNKNNYSQTIEQANKPVLVYFHMDACGPCRMFEPGFLEVSRMYRTAVDFATVDIDTNWDFTVGLGIRVGPTVFLYKNGKVIASFQGAKTRQNLESWLNGQLEAAE